MSKREIRAIIVKVLVLFMLIACVALLSTGGPRRLVSSSSGIAEPQQGPVKGDPLSKAAPQDSAPPTMWDFLNKSSRHSGQPPVGDFGKGPAESQEAHERRRIRENLHGKGFYKRRIEDPGAKIVNGQAETVLFTIPDRVTDGERRYRTIGAALNGVVLVAHTVREVSANDELVRIISARYATSSERKAYEEGV